MMDLQASNVLLCLRYGIGDLIMELPVLDRLREALPQARITGLGAEPAIEILDDDGRLDEVLSIQKWGIGHLGNSPDDSARQQLADWLGGRRFDLILDPSHAASGARDAIYQQDVPRRDSDSACIEVGLAQGLDGLSAVKQGIWQSWGLDVPASYHPVVRLHAAEIEWARRSLADRGLTQDLIAVSPGASGDLKRWPVERFAQLCRYLFEELGTRVLLLCGPGEIKLQQELCERTQGLGGIEIIRNLHLRRVAALLSQCGLCVGNDSGLLHLAAAVGTPVVVLFGPTDDHLYLPRWVPARAVASGIPCPYRPRRAFGHPRCVLVGSCLIGAPCIEAIEPAQVCAAVKEEWQGPRRRIVS